MGDRLVAQSVLATLAPAQRPATAADAAALLGEVRGLAAGEIDTAFNPLAPPLAPVWAAADANGDMLAAALAVALLALGGLWGYTRLRPDFRARTKVEMQLRGLLLMRPFHGQLHVCLVEPCLTRVGKPMLLVSADRMQAFELDAAGRLVERAVPSAGKVKKGIERAWADLTRRMLAVTTEAGEFRFGSWIAVVPVQEARPR